MIRHDALDDVGFTFRQRANEQYISWRNYLFPITNLQSFKKAEGAEERGVLLTFPYGEVLLPCRSNEILVRVLDKLENYLKEINTVTPPVADTKVSELKKSILIPPNQVLKIGKSEIVLLGLKDLSVKGKILTFYYESNPLKPSGWTASNENEAQAVFEQIQGHLKNLLLLKIFKEHQSNNPVASAPELWEKAKETYELINQLNLTAFY